MWKGMLHNVRPKGKCFFPRRNLTNDAGFRIFAAVNLLSPPFSSLLLFN